jgi:hypothetical protein
MNKEINLDEYFVKEIRKIQYIEHITRTPILSKYRVDEYDRYLADEGHHINHLSKEAFEYYYNVYVPRMKKLGNVLNEMAVEAQKHVSESFTSNNPFCSEFNKEDKNEKENQRIN